MATTLPAERRRAFDDFYKGAMKKDAARIRSALTDDFTFRGPTMSVDNPDAFVEILLNFDADVTNSRLIVDGERVAHQFVLDVAAPMQAKFPMCDVLEFQGDGYVRSNSTRTRSLFEPADG